jgi:ring-1,2-phenylacetyl-CoA epoxidase subunit PaaC
MVTFESYDGLTDYVRSAVVNLLYRLADDELVIGHGDLAWAELMPIQEDATVFSSMARDEISHARSYYGMLHQLGEGDPDNLAFERGPRQFRCASLVCLPDRQDWAFCLLRRFLYDAAEVVRLTALCQSALRPLAELAARLRTEEERHLVHGRRWVLRLGRSAEESRRKMQAALHHAYPHALGLFEPTEADEPLAQSGICPREEELRRQWESAVAPVLADAGLDAPEMAPPAYGGRVGRHPQMLAELLSHMQRAHHFNRSADQ